MGTLSQLTNTPTVPTKKQILKNQNKHAAVAFFCNCNIAELHSLQTIRSTLESSRKVIAAHSVKVPQVITETY